MLGGSDPANGRDPSLASRKFFRSSLRRTSSNGRTPPASIRSQATRYSITDPRSDQSISAEAKKASKRRDVERARDITASQNHSLIPEGDVSSEPISSIAVPTLVIHGTADPMFPLAHGQALAEEIPGVRLLALEGAGHGIDRADWEPVARAVLVRTAAAERGP